MPNPFCYRCGVEITGGDIYTRPKGLDFPVRNEAPAGSVFNVPNSDTVVFCFCSVEHALTMPIIPSEKTWFSILNTQKT